ncbi:hypothetical protein HPP92_000652 [Vanilla planifolia]|uniref:Protein kinase domain-containing protein n=1 Tax=Vanilla planifolia TaxID=51239 RepID=A0A835RWN7_VANPL|nr:hypothetical protein HPP92_000652 [Vanilla planifolia]
MHLPILFLLLWICVSRGNSINLDMAALLEFKKGISGGPMSRVLDSWDQFASPASEVCPFNWYGVQCNGNRVISITLNDLGLVGNISLSSLAHMHMLRNLSLANNQLSGILTPELRSLTSLEHLDLSRNSFFGRIPEELMDIGNLVHLNLSWNMYGAMLPSGFNKLRQLKFLDLRANSFVGDVGLILGQLKTAVYVDLSQNSFTGSLSSISDDSSITGSLQYLNISHNGLSGQLFGENLVPLFDSLEVFDTCFNRLSGQVPSFNFIVSLKVLCLGNNQFSGSFPEALFKDFSMVLAELDLSNNNLSGPLQSITSTSLRKLNLSKNNLSGSLPAKIGSCTIVDLSENLFSGNISAIGSWGNYVESIDLSSNKLKGTMLNETSQFLRLKSLKISNNLLEGELPEVMGTYPGISVIDLSQNHLNGSIPQSLLKSVSIVDLNLSGNSFTGPIFLKSVSEKSGSPAMPLLPSPNSSLVSMDLSNNFLNGSLPQELSTMRQLRLLNISRNNISGQIPKDIAMLDGLLYMDLSGNHFEGPIPDNLPNGLLQFNVSYNNLSGEVPNNLLRFPDSSFHPGNILLVFPPSFSNATRADHHGKRHHHLKKVVVYGLVAGAFVCSIVGILIMLTYHWLYLGNSRRGVVHWIPTLPRFSKTTRHAELHPGSSSFLQDHSIQTRTSSGQTEQGVASLASTDPVEARSQDPFHVHESLRMSDEKISVLSSPPFNQQTSTHCPSILNVHSPDRLAGDLHLFENSVVFTVEELSRAPAEIIGRSCHGTSYKATLDRGHVLTIKRLNEGIVKSKKEFSRELKKLGTIRHANLVSLKGYYWGPNEHERLLISDCVDACSLTVRLCEFENQQLSPLTLKQRLSIATDVAGCLNYLHNERAIPHGNIKSTNILIQPNMNTLVTDYSLHRIMTPSGMAEQVLNAGALGYRPPEFASTSKPCPSLKGDVYAFGVILLELLTGKNAGEIVSGNPGVVDLTDWVRLLASENRSYECFDRNAVHETDGEGFPRALEELLRVALRCIKSADERPEMRTVLDDLSSILL